MGPARVIAWTSVVCFAAFSAWAPGAARGQERAAGGDETANGLAAYQWERRILILAGPVDAHERFAAQAALFEGREAGFAERGLARIALIGGSVVTADLAEADGLEADALRAALTLPEDVFSVTLIGLDGEVKARWSDPVAADALFERIDAMAMRQEDIRRNDSERDALRQDFEG